MRIKSLLVIALLLIVFTSTHAQTPVPQPMLDFVLHAAQALNAQFGPVIDYDNVVWDYDGYGFDLAAAQSRCPNLGQTPPALPANTSIYVVEFKPVHDGLWGDVIWYMLVYGDLSFVTPCELPPTPTPVAPQPPVVISTPTRCFGVLPSRLVIGQPGRVTAGDLPNNIRSTPGTSGDFLGEIPPGSIFMVLDGPRCFSDLAWWQVNYNGVVGWTPEGDGEEYWLEPGDRLVAPSPTPTPASQLAPTAVAIVCNPNAPSRLQVGELAQVTPGIPNNVRALPGSSGEYLGEIPPEQPFTVLAGPECSSGMAWWQVDFNGLVGWTPEGETADDYWLEPLITFITADNVNQVSARGTLQIADINPLAIVPQSASQLTVVGDSGVALYTTSDELVWQLQSTLPLMGRLAPNSVFTPSTLAPRIPRIDGENRLVVRGSTGDIMLADSGTVVATASQSRWIAASVNSELRVWAADGTPQTLNGGAYTASVELLRFSPDGVILAAASLNETIIWDTVTWTPQRVLNDGVGLEDGLIDLNKDFIALSGGELPGVRLYAISTGTLVNLAVDNPTALAFSPQSALLVIADEANGIQVWDAMEGIRLPETLESVKLVRQMAFSPAGDALFALDSEGVVTVWMIAS